MTHQDPADGRITTALRDGLFLIGIDRPAKLNGFTPVMLRGLAQAYTAFDREPRARCAVVFAEGTNFTAGLDLPKVAPHLGGNTLLVEEGEIDLFACVRFRSKPVVVAVQESASRSARS
jgi:enoyl-CoA hydratase/carnithine racemase